MAQAESEDDEIEEVVVTGSRIKRRELTTMSPIAVIGAPDYSLSGTTNVERLLNTMPQVIPGEGGFTNNESSGVATIDLRGLGTQRSLVLVNGRRYMFYDSRQVTDLNTIPAALVAGTELVTGGSSAVYGSDAVGGVVNFILKDDFEGVELTGQYDVSGEGDGDVVNVDLTMGGNFAEDKGNAVVYMNYLQRDPVLADARSQSVFFLVDGTDANGNPILTPGGSSGIPNGRVSGFPTSGPEFEARPGVQQALVDLGLTGVGSLGFKFDETGQNVSTFVSPGDQYNFNPLNYLQLPQDRQMIGALASYDLSDRFEAYAETMFVNNRVETKRDATPAGGVFPIQVDSPFLTAGIQNLLAELDATEGTVQRDANGNPVLGGDGLPIIVPAATRNDGYTNLSISRRLSEVGTRDVTFERNAWRTLLGVRGEMGDVGILRNAEVDAYYSYARTRNTVNSFGSTLADAFEQGLTTAFDGAGNLVCLNPANGCIPINVFGANISDEAASFIRTSQTSSEEATMQVAAATLTGGLFDLPAGPLGIAIGAEYRKVEGFFIPSQGGIGDVDSDPVGGDYDVNELFGEILVPILETVELSTAFRYSNYSLDGIGGSWTYGAGLTWAATPGIMLRGQYQRAVRAPSIDELFVAASGTSPAAVDPCAQPAAATDPVVRELCIANGVPVGSVGDPGLQPNFQIREVSGGNLNLREESTDTYTYGIVLAPEFAPGLTATVDYFSIDVEDAITVLGGSANNVLDLCFNQIQNIDSPFCQAVVRLQDGVIANPGGVFVLNTNIGKIETSGVDIRVNYGFDVGFGLFDGESTVDIAAGLTWLNAFDITPVAELPDLVNECADSFGLTCSEPLPEYKSTTRVSWQDGPMTLSLRWRWIDSVTDDQINLSGRDPATLAAPFTGSVNYFDLTSSFLLGDTYTMTFGIENLLDETQPILGSSQEQLNTFPSTYDPFGRKFFLSATAHF
jgi:outer membrane receptor protein involved in Fe transport